MTVSEWATKWMVTWAELRNRRRQVLSMNQRNLLYIYPNNPRSFFPIADDKLLTKKILADHGVPVPETFHVYDSFYSLRRLQADLESLSDFVIKPACGSGGGGIVVITRREGSDWFTASGERYDLERIKKHLSDIIFGVHSFGLTDQAMIESRLIQHSEIDQIYSGGLSDLRIIVHQNRAVMAMLRVPTRRSQGKANLHQGGIGAGVDLSTGKINHAIHDNKPIFRHIDSGFELGGFALPHWQQVEALARQVSQGVPLKYIGIDVALTVNGPVILEINARPGIAIQNANNRGLAHALIQVQAQPQTLEATR